MFDKIDQLAVNAIRTLSIDQVEAANSGHPGLPMGAAPMTYALWNLQDRGQLFITPQTEVYEGMIIGVSAKTQDIEVNPTINKKMTAVRSTGNDEAMKLVPARTFSLEEALEFINDDELVEITPDSIRLRKKYLTNLDRRRHMREINKEASK